MIKSILKIIFLGSASAPCMRAVFPANKQPVGWVHASGAVRRGATSSSRHNKSVLGCLLLQPLTCSATLHTLWGQARRWNDSPFLSFLRMFILQFGSFLIFFSSFLYSFFTFLWLPLSSQTSLSTSLIYSVSILCFNTFHKMNLIPVWLLWRVILIVIWPAITCNLFVYCLLSC